MPGEYRKLQNQIKNMAIDKVLYTPPIAFDISKLMSNWENFINKSEDGIDPLYSTKHYTTIDSSNYVPIVDGMDLVINGGPGSTARNAKIKDIVVCGKTGTAENPHGNDHSIFIAFAPKDDPKIAIAVYVENQGYGTTYAAPIASLMIEKYLTREVKRTWYENWVMQKEQPVVRSTNRSIDTTATQPDTIQEHQ